MLIGDIEWDQLGPDLSPGGVHDVLIRHLAAPTIGVQHPGGAVTLVPGVGVRTGQTQLLTVTIAIGAASGAGGLVGDVNNGDVSQ